MQSQSLEGSDQWGPKDWAAMGRLEGGGTSACPRQVSAQTAEGLHSHTGGLWRSTESFWRMLWEHNSTILVMLTGSRGDGQG